MRFPAFGGVRVRGSYECIRICKLIEDAYAFLTFVLV